MLKSVLNVVQAAAMIVVVALVSIQAPQMHRKYIRSLAEESSVKVVGDAGSGTGFHVDLDNGKQVILTNKHVCGIPGQLYVESFNGDRVAVKILKLSKQHDLCALVRKDGLKFTHKGLTISDKNPKIGEILYTLGHPRGDALNVAIGEYFDNPEIELGSPIFTEQEFEACIKDGGRVGSFFIFNYCITKHASIQLSTPTYPGNSGSAVVDWSGDVVAVIFAGNTEVENTGFAVPLSFVQEFVKSL